MATPEHPRDLWAGSPGNKPLLSQHLVLANKKITRRLERPWHSFCTTKLPEQAVISSEFGFDSFEELKTTACLVGP